MSNFKAVRMRIVGVVQGVGFRPFTYRLAKALGLRGYVVNLGGGEVEIHIEGDERALREFSERVVREAPQGAVIFGIHYEEAEPLGLEEFVIREGERRAHARSVVPPDIAICEDCVTEVLSGTSRFYGYPWHSCVRCGPRFSMMYGLPYERDNTSMGAFKLCEECESEYRDPSNLRRFYAQGISCPRCGPQTRVYTGDGKRLEVDDPVSFAAEAIEDGHIVALKGVGGYHIACLASRDDVVAELRARKKRPSQPFALMARDMAVVEELVVVLPGARELLEAPQRPIVVLPKRGSSRVSELVAPGLSTLGVMLPYTGLHVLLMREVRDGFLIMTSGNPHSEPMCTDLSCVLTKLKGVVDYVVDHDRAIVHRVDDSVVRFTDGEPVFLRRSRGYAPQWIEVPLPLVEGVAVGADLQGVGAIGFEGRIVLTQYIGDLEVPAHLEDLLRELLWFVKVYGVKPRLVARDLHPRYHSRRVAEILSSELGGEMVDVQHHHAHAAAVMAECGVESGARVVAVTVDGVGYGPDGSVWGGEVLVATYRDFVRAGHLMPFTLPGGDAAVRYPVKPLIALMVLAGYSEEEVLKYLKRLEILRALPYGEAEASLTYWLAKRGRGPATSSIGRVLDAFAALLGVCTIRTYEGEPAILLEALADRGKHTEYTPKISVHEGRPVVDLVDVLNWALESLERMRREDIAATVLRALGRGLGLVVVSALRGLRNCEGFVVVGGGAAVNTHIIRGLKDVLGAEDLEVRVPKKAPPGDGGIALGQLAVASSRLGE